MKKIQFLRNDTVYTPSNSGTAIQTAKNAIMSLEDISDGEIVLARYQESRNDDIKTLICIYYENSTDSGWTFIGGLRAEIEETEETIAQALSDLDERVTENTTVISSMSDLSSRMTQAEADITELGEIIEENEEITAGALSDLDARLTSETTARETLEQVVEDNELVTARAFTEVDRRITELEGQTPGGVETDPVFTASPAHSITSSDILNWNSKTDNVGTITGITMNGVSKGTSGVVNLGTVLTSHQDISGKADKSAAIGSLSLALDSTNYKITLSGTKVDGTSFTVSNVIDLPLESVVVSGSYNNTTKKVVLTLQNGSTIDFSVADLVAGLQSEITSTNKLSADLISDGMTNKVVTSTEKNTWNNAASNSHMHSNKTVLDGITSTDITNWNSKTDNVGTVTGVKMNNTTNSPTDGVVDLGTVITSETLLSKGTTTGSGNAVTDITVNNHQITLTKGSTFLTSHQSIKTINGNSLVGTGDVTIIAVPSFTSADNGKVLGVVNGQLAWVTPTTIYTGSGAPSSSQGNDGDIYLQTS